MIEQAISSAEHTCKNAQRLAKDLIITNWYLYQAVICKNRPCK